MVFRHYLYIGLLFLIGVPLWAQSDRAIKREREEMVSEQRVALVIGNGQYEHIDTLRNPVNDALGMARVLRSIGFEVIELVNGNRTAMRNSIYKFEKLIHAKAEVALFYFAGHGLQAIDEDHSKNYLVPIDADIQGELEVPEACISADWVLRILQEKKGNRVNLIILDACRNNPFESRSFRTTGGQGVIGLTGMSAPSGSVIAYSADAGQVAWDGEGRHSPYTGSLIRHINTPGTTILDVFTRVAADVQNATQHLTSPQVPWLSTNLTQNLSLVPPSDPPYPIPAQSLHEAAGLNRTEEVLRLLMGGGEVNARNKAGQTPLHVAARFNAGETAEVLLNQRADVNSQDNEGNTPLHTAVQYYDHQNNALQIAKLLLSKGADVNARNNSSRTPFDIAKLSQAKEIIGVLRGSVFRDCVECPEMVIVPSGSFIMGSPDNEDSRHDNEGPRHRVQIEYPLAVGVYEVMFAEWDACVNDDGCGEHNAYDQGWGRGNRPVINVNWDDAQSYVRWLSKKTGHTYGLLGESEWEYVARAGTQTPFYFGSTISPEQANYDGTSQKDVSRGMTISVGSFSANGWGVHDMHGNVWEWVQDCWNDSYAGAPADGSAWESGDCDKHVLRGGSWFDGQGDLRSGNRDSMDPRIRAPDVGFRVARRF